MVSWDSLLTMRESSANFRLCYVGVDSCDCLSDDWDGRAEDNPVCGVDGKTYTNSCQAYCEAGGVECGKECPCSSSRRASHVSNSELIDV